MMFPTADPSCKTYKLKKPSSKTTLTLCRQCLWQDWERNIDGPRINNNAGHAKRHCRKYQTEKEYLSPGEHIDEL